MMTVTMTENDGDDDGINGKNDINMDFRSSGCQVFFFYCLISHNNNNNNNNNNK